MDSYITARLAPAKPGKRKADSFTLTFHGEQLRKWIEEHGRCAEVSFEHGHLDIAFRPNLAHYKVDPGWTMAVPANIVRLLLRRFSGGFAPVKCDFEGPGPGDKISVDLPWEM